jgi:hypothetical protein
MMNYAHQNLLLECSHHLDRVYNTVNIGSRREIGHDPLADIGILNLNRSVSASSLVASGKSLHSHEAMKSSLEPYGQN